MIWNTKEGWRFFFQVMSWRRERALKQSYVAGREETWKVGFVVPYQGWQHQLDQLDQDTVGQKQQENHLEMWRQAWIAQRWHTSLLLKHSPAASIAWHASWWDLYSPSFPFNSFSFSVFLSLLWVLCLLHKKGQHPFVVDLIFWISKSSNWKMSPLNLEQGICHLHSEDDENVYICTFPEEICMRF